MMYLIFRIGEKKMYQPRGKHIYITVRREYNKEEKASLSLMLALHPPHPSKATSSYGTSKDRGAASDERPACWLDSKRNAAAPGLDIVEVVYSVKIRA